MKKTQKDYFADAFFPRYRINNPVVPAWCITPNEKGCIHRFFDTSPLSPSGRFLATFQLPFEDRQPVPGEKGNVRLVDLWTGENRIVTETCGWEPQLGANLNWGKTDNELFFNDVDIDTWKPFAWKLDPMSGEKLRMEGTVYHASPDGKWLISGNLPLIRKTQAGYGIVVPAEKTRRNVGLVEDDGFYLSNTSTGECRLLVSLQTLMAQAKPPLLYENIDNCEIYGAHCKFNPQGTRLMLSVRWFAKQATDVWEIAEKNYKTLRFAWFTIPLSGDPIHCAIGPEQFMKGGHHATWFPDGEHISLNLRLDGESMRFVSVRYDGTQIREIIRCVRGSGHPTVHPSGHILTDTYLKGWDFPQHGDGTVPLRWVNMRSGKECELLRVCTQQPCPDPALRIDPHPAWDRSWRYVIFNGFWKGSRRVFLADMKPLLSGSTRPKMRRRRIGKDSLKYRTRKTLARAKSVCQKFIS